LAIFFSIASSSPGKPSRSITAVYSERLVLVQLVEHQHRAARLRFLACDFEGLAAVAVEARGEGGDAEPSEDLDQPGLLGFADLAPVAADRDPRHEGKIESFR
jgi:hypothetical protein